MKAWGGMETYEEIRGIEGVAMKRHTVRGEERHSAARETIGKEKKKQYCTEQEKRGLASRKLVIIKYLKEIETTNSANPERLVWAKRPASYMSELSSALGAR